MERICHHHKVAMKIALAIITKIQIFHGHNRTKLIASELCSYFSSRCFLPNKYFLSEIIHFIFSSHSNSNNDNWNGFDSSFETSSQVYQASSSQSIQNQHKIEKSEKAEKNDFNSLDVKASKQKPATKAKSIEDDAWNLLNN